MNFQKNLIKNNSGFSFLPFILILLLVFSVSIGGYLYHKKSITNNQQILIQESKEESIPITEETIVKVKEALNLKQFELYYLDKLEENKIFLNSMKVATYNDIKNYDGIYGVFTTEEYEGDATFERAPASELIRRTKYLYFARIKSNNYSDPNNIEYFKLYTILEGPKRVDYSIKSGIDFEPFIDNDNSYGFDNYNLYYTKNDVRDRFFIYNIINEQVEEIKIELGESLFQLVKSGRKYHYIAGDLEKSKILTTNLYYFDIDSKQNVLVTKLYDSNSKDRLLSSEIGKRIRISKASPNYILAGPQCRAGGCNYYFTRFIDVNKKTFTDFNEYEDTNQISNFNEILKEDSSSLEEKILYQDSRIKR